MNAYEIARSADLSIQGEQALMDIHDLMADNVELGSLAPQRALAQALRLLPNLASGPNLDQALAFARSHALNGARLDEPIDGMTPLQLACKAGSFAVVAAFCHLGANPSALNESGISALSSCIALRHVHCAKTLIDAGARLDEIASVESGLERSAPRACALAGLSALGSYARDRLAAQLELEAIDQASKHGSATRKSAL